MASSWKEFFFGKKDTQPSRSSAGDMTVRHDCPVDSMELGRSTWTFLHTMAAYVPDQPTRRERRELSHFMGTLSRFYPCQPCAQEMQTQLKKEPPQVNTRDDFSQWMCRLHNEVNTRLGKPLFDCSRVDERWRDGWKDGRCD